jgi:hypothetical protein
MGFVDHLLPLPHSDYLLTRDVLSSVAPVIIKTAGEMKQQQKARRISSQPHPPLPLSPSVLYNIKVPF